VTPWLTAGSVYTVLTVQAAPNGPVWLRVETDEPGSLGLFDSVYFETFDESVPATWAARIHPGGRVELAPSAWLVPGFWDAYYNDAPEAIVAFQREVTATRGRGTDSED
jgi:hypothetical protein